MLHLRLYLTAALLVSTCGSTELCQGDSKCTMCTVTGRSVIDIQGMLDFAKDRCTYALMSTTSIPNFHVQATFQERRRKDIYFLDRVNLSLTDQKVHITLEQGGVVQLDGVQMQLTAKARLVHGVELSKDQTGVTAKKSHLNYAMTVFFDGYTAQIHIKGPSGQTPSVKGLCGNSLMPFSDSWLSVKEPGCETPHEDTTDSTIDCKKMTERCNLLMQAPFTACQSYVNRNPYFNACTDTLCKYPATDGLDCQFLEAYARACSLHRNDILGGWRSKAKCSPKAFCQDRFCSTDEFCGENSHGNATRCHCRAIFADPYRTKHAMGDAVVCDKTSRSVSLVACLLEDNGISPSDLQLYDKTCRGEMDKVTHMVKLGFDTKTKPCGTMIKMNNKGEVVNKNAVMVGSTGEEMIDFTCPFLLPDISINFSVKIKVKSGVSKTTVAYVTSGVWTYTLTMKAFTDAGLTQAVTPATPLRLNQKIWVELKTHGVDQPTVTLVTNSCYATNEPSPNAPLTYYLISKGCANRADGSVKLEGSGQRSTNVFSFALFQFIGKNKDVYLHCKLRLCDKQIETCAPDCSKAARRRRSHARRNSTAYKYKEQNQTSIVMAWGT
ncbi:alpha-tectorin-like [Clinocottus analis]|uniref:alpha-tectorin-like n=1 Tax=Clinocottus analis TaxID=304258 RepID=UPI0035C0CA80